MHRAAAVAVAVTEEGWGADEAGIARPASWSTDAALILTRRAASLGRHAGQWALPGGRIDPGEVASIHGIPVNEFMRADAPLLDAIGDSAHPALRMPVGQHWIAAPTAAVLYQFRELCIAGRPTRVAHFEQPLFARK